MLLSLIAYVCYCLFAIEFPECEACYLESLGYADRQQGKLHFDDTPLSPSFYALVPILKHCMVRMSLTCGLGSS